MTHMVIFRVAGIVYAFPRAQTEQVMPDVRVTRVPLALSAFDGVVYAKSRLVPVLHMRKRLGLPPAAGPESMLIVRFEGDLLGLRVDGVLEDATWGAGEPPGVLLDLSRLLAHGAPVGEEGVVPRTVSEGSRTVPLGRREV